MSTGYKKLLKHTPVEEIECLKKTGLQDLRALLDTEEGKQFLQVVEVLDVGKTQKPSKAKLEKAVEAYVDFQVEHTSELQKTLAQVASFSSRLYLGAMQNLEQLSLIDRKKAWSKKLTGDQPKVMKKWISSPGDEDKFKAALLDAMVTKVSKNKKPKSKRKDSSDESSDDDEEKKDDDDEETDEESNGSEDGGDSEGGDISSESSSDKKKKKANKQKPTKKSAGKDDAKGKESKQTKKKKRASSSSFSEPVKEKKKVDKAAKKDNLSPLKTKERRGKSEADEQQDAKRMKADVAQEAEELVTAKIAAFTCWTPGNCEKFLSMAMKRQLDVGNLEAGVFPVAEIQSLWEMLPEQIRKLTPAVLQRHICYLVDQENVTIIIAKTILRGFVQVGNEIQIFFEEQAGHNTTTCGVSSQQPQGASG